MKICSKGLNPSIMDIFSSSVGVNNFLFYAGSMVSVEQALSIAGLFTPLFFEREGCIFWENAVTEEYKNENKSIYLLDSSEFTEKEIVENKRTLERYANNFALSSHFQKWEKNMDASISEEELDKREISLLICFAEQLEKYWRLALADCFPDKKFDFEISENGIEDECGVCLTFWHVED